MAWKFNTGFNRLVIVILAKQMLIIVINSMS